MLVIKPYTRKPIPKPVGIVVDCNRVIGEWEGERWKDIPSSAVLYANDVRDVDVRYQTGELIGNWWKSIGNKRRTSWTYRKQRIYFIRGTLDAIPIEQRLPTLLEFVGTVRDAGAAVGSPVGMLRSLQRVHCETAFIESSYGVPIQHVWRGPRIQQSSAVRGQFESVALWDIKSAYPTALTNVQVPRRWTDHTAMPHERIPDVPAGFALAIVRVPWMMYGPLPDVGIKHPTKNFPTDTFLKGVWSFDELHAAEAVGAEIFLLRYWIGNHYRQPFQEWGSIVRDLRANVGPDAERLVKMAANRFVGTLAMDGHQEHSWIENGIEQWSADSGRAHPTSLTTHGTVTSAVRAQLFQEGIHPFPGHFVFCHTDGVALLAEDMIPSPRWVIKALMDALYLINPERYAYRTFPDPKLHYITAGIPDIFAGRFFERAWLKLPRSRADGMIYGTKGGDEDGKPSRTRTASRVRTQPAGRDSAQDGARHRFKPWRDG